MHEQKCRNEILSKIKQRKYNTILQIYSILKSNRQEINTTVEHSICIKPHEQRETPNILYVILQNRYS